VLPGQGHCLTWATGGSRDREIAGLIHASANDGRSFPKENFADGRFIFSLLLVADY
jgi:hypothetical protein